MRLLATLVLVAALACASRGTDAIWIDSEAKPADPEELRIARDACAAEVADRDDEAGSETVDFRFGYLTWGQAMIECMEERGFLLIEAEAVSSDRD